MDARAMRVVITTHRLDGFYSVTTEPPSEHYREFWWGMFDDGDVAWQTARKWAREYAAQVEKKMANKK